MPDHEDCHGSQSHSQPGHVAEQVATEELVRSGKGAGHRDHGENQAHDERAPLDGLDHWWRHQVQVAHTRRTHFGPSSFSFPALGAITGKVAPEPGSPRNSGGSDGIFCPAGTSPTEAPWLNCKART